MAARRPAAVHRRSGILHHEPRPVGLVVEPPLGGAVARHVSERSWAVRYGPAYGDFAPPLATLNPIPLMLDRGLNIGNGTRQVVVRR